MPKTNNPTVLVVEDEALLRDLLVTELEDAGYQVIEAEDGSGALRVIDSDRRIDLLLTDIRLPGGQDGWSIARHARTVRPDLPIIYATGYSAEPIEQPARSTLIRKPFLARTMIQVAAALGVPAPALAGEAMMPTVQQIR